MRRCASSWISSLSALRAASRSGQAADIRAGEPAGWDMEASPCGGPDKALVLQP